MNTASNWIAALSGFLLSVHGISGAADERGEPDSKGMREQFAQANRFYAAQEYEKARDLYRSMAGQILSSEVQFNLGNCYFRLGQTGQACLAYRRALLADPGMVEARQNLRFLRNKLGYLSFETSGVGRAVSRLTPRQWLWVTTFGAWILILGVTCRLAFRIRPPLGGMVIALACCGGMVSLTGGGASYYLLRQSNSGRLAIVVEDSAVALTGPFPDARPVQSMSPGSEVRVKAVRDGWLFVYIPGDAAGWIEGRAVETLWPARS